MIFALEGIDGSGKSSVIYEMKKAIGTEFCEKHVVFTKEPRYTKDMLDVNNPFQQLHLFMADHERHLEEVIIPHKDDIIFTDRYIASRVAYFASHFTGREERFWAGMYADMLHGKKGIMGVEPYYPTVNYLLMINEDTLRQHLSSRYKGEKVSEDEITRLLDIQDIYHQIAKSDRDKFYLIDINDTTSKHDTVRKILSNVKSRIDEIQG
jgi:thymidylate kinase